MAHTGTSYGMNLQAYAMQYVIESLGYETEIILMRGGSLRNLRIDFGTPWFIFKTLYSRIQDKKYLNKRFPDIIHVRNHELRIKAAQLFRANRLHGFTPMMLSKDLTEYSKKYYAVVIGSDQLWLPGFSFGMRSSLRFVPDGVKRISYATSLGVSSYPKYCYPSARNAWSQFDYLSVREEEGKKIIQQVCGNDTSVEVVLDPTYLITKTQWELLVPVEQIVQGKYVLSFILGNNEAQLICAKRFADAHNLKLVSILSNESSSGIDTTYADVVIEGKGPADFINLVRGAEYIFTDSFHGIAFSVINQKQLFAFLRKHDLAKGKASRDSRIFNILRTWNLQNRLLKNTDIDWSTYLYDPINYKNVNQLLDKARANSLEYLKNALSAHEENI